MFQKVLIANRGEIALRIHRACKEMGIQTVAVHSTADSNAMHVRLADESVCIGPPSAQASYLNIPSLIAACEITGAEAVHPGYGFLSENARFAEILHEHHITFIGPLPEHIHIMGDKIAAKEKMQSLGIPTVPGSKGLVKNVEHARELSKDIGFPILIKASAGGGGRGMKLANAPQDLEKALQLAQAEAKAAFGNDAVYMEKYLSGPRHIEVQVLCDKFGNVIHLGERDCSLQRRHQKILEECPASTLSAEAKKQLRDIVSGAMNSLGYLGAGTLEFLYQDGHFYFIEMNTRLQVEHPVTEMVTGVDIVREQIRIAAGLPLSYKQEDIHFLGHAIECRINAEDCDAQFQPSPGYIEDFHTPGGFGVRMDSAVYAGSYISPYYDSLIGKLIVHDHTREECIARLKRALQECVVTGVKTTLPLFGDLLDQEDFIKGRYDIFWLEDYLKKYTKNKEDVG